MVIGGMAGSLGRRVVQMVQNVDARREHSRKPDCVRDRIERLVLGPFGIIRPRNETGMGLLGPSSGAL
jgi:hypothetical protein